MKARATEVLRAFARSDTEAIARLCADDVLLWGTDEGEEWEGRASVLEAFACVYDLSVRWVGEPRVEAAWVAGHVEFGTPDGGLVRARVTMAFGDGGLVHAHYSVAAAA
jgi:ketosteroid isomerase-like protein